MHYDALERLPNDPIHVSRARVQLDFSPKVLHTHFHDESLEPTTQS